MLSTGDSNERVDCDEWLLKGMESKALSLKALPLYLLFHESIIN
jgi:hypothetical protein